MLPPPHLKCNHFLINPVLHKWDVVNHIFAISCDHSFVEMFVEDCIIYFLTKYEMLKYLNTF